MSLAATPPSQSRHSRQWYIVVFSLVGIVGLGAVFGGVHWYNGYARSLPPAVTTPRLLDKNNPAEKKAEAAEKKAEKTSGAEAGVKASPSAGAGDQANATEKVSSHKPAAKPTSTPGA
jgi:hypothetical protein